MQTQCPVKGQGRSLRAELACLLILLTTTITWLLGDSLHSYNKRSDHECTIANPVTYYTEDSFNLVLCLYQFRQMSGLSGHCARTRENLYHKLCKPFQQSTFTLFTGSTPV